MKPPPPLDQTPRLTASELSLQCLHIISKRISGLKKGQLDVFSNRADWSFFSSVLEVLGFTFQAILTVLSQCG